MSDVNKYLNSEGIVNNWPKKLSNKIEILRYIIKNFEFNVIYTEKEINQIISSNHTFNDYFLIRRELIEHKLLIRTKDGSKYWRGDSIPRSYETERLIIRDSLKEDESSLNDVNMSVAYIEEYTGVKHEPSYIKDILENGDLPPNGSVEFYKVKSIIKKDNKEIIGFIEYYMGYPSNHTLWISTFYLKKEYQSLGFGKEVIESIENLLVDSSFTKLAIGVHLKNWKALRFWVNSGFREISQIVGDEDYGVDKFSIIALEKRL